VFCLEPLVVLPQRIVTDFTGLCARDGVDHALGRRVDSGASRGTVVRPPRHRSPSAPEDSGSVAHPHVNRSTHHVCEPARSKVIVTWCARSEAHSLHPYPRVNGHARQKALS
jgi:hypothetical protein